MRVRASAFFRLAAVAVIVYFAALLVWRAFEPIYLRALAVFLERAEAAGMISSPVQVVLVPAQGLAIIGGGSRQFAVPQRIIGADLALFVALLAATSWLPWRQRARRLAAGLLAIFAVHLATVIAQTGVDADSVLWRLWTTLYQGKVVPVAVWAALCAPFTRGYDSIAAARCTSSTTTSRKSRSG